MNKKLSHTHTVGADLCVCPEMGEHTGSPLLAALIIVIGFSGCLPMSKPENVVQIYKVPDAEAPWIRSGDPLMYKDAAWYPADDTEYMTDSEVDKLGEYQGVDFFVAKEDVEPYERLYTKFERNRYRYFLLKQP